MAHLKDCYTISLQIKQMMFYGQLLKMITTENLTNEVLMRIKSVKTFVTITKETT